VPVGFLGAAVAVLAAQLLTLKEAYDAIEWPVLILFGARILAGSGRSGFSSTRRLVRPSRKDRLNDARRQQRQAEDPADVALRDVLGIADLADRGGRRAALGFKVGCSSDRRLKELLDEPKGGRAVFLPRWLDLACR
jgi:hypothetical protein